MAKRKSASGKSHAVASGEAVPKDIDKDASGVGYEKVVARLQQLMDPNSSVTHNEILEDRVGNKRQYDVVIRGTFAGRPVLGVVECKDHARKKGPDAIEAFAKKTENLGANLRMMVSRVGFTAQALRLAKYEHVDCFSTLSESVSQGGFTIGDWWYGIIRKWKDFRLHLFHSSGQGPLTGIDPETVKFNGKRVYLWFIREIITQHDNETEEGEHTLTIKFAEPTDIEINGEMHKLTAIACTATRIYKTKREFVNWFGGALYNWQDERVTIPNGGTLTGTPVESDLTLWPDYDGALPDFSQPSEPRIPTIVMIDKSNWDSSRDHEVPEISSLMGIDRPTNAAAESAQNRAVERDDLNGLTFISISHS